MRFLQVNSEKQEETEENGEKILTQSQAVKKIDAQIKVDVEDVDKAKEFRINYLKFMYKLFGEKYKKELDDFYKRPHDKEFDM